jgi:hypothetical protein
MGAIADAVVAYMQPLLDQTDGSVEDMNKALALGQLCYNLALLPDDDRDASLREMQQASNMGEAEFADFRQSIIDPMIQRHKQMFPGLHRRGSFGFSTPLTDTSERTRGGRYPGTDRYAPCPCGSGEKYKFCCGAKRR